MNPKYFLQMSFVLILALTKCEFYAWFLYEMVAHFTLRTYDVNKVFFREKKIEFDDSFDVIKCLQQIEMPDLLHLCIVKWATIYYKKPWTHGGLDML